MIMFESSQRFWQSIESCPDLPSRLKFAFETIRDVPYVLRGFPSPASDLCEDHLQQIFAERRGGCTEKSEALAHVLTRLGIQVEFGVVSFLWSDTLRTFRVASPTTIARLAEGLEECYHTLLFGSIGQRSVLLDPTWDAGLADLGVPINLHWDASSDMRLGIEPCTGIERFPTALDALDFKRRRYVLRRCKADLPSELRRQRFKRFVEAMNNWLDANRRVSSLAARAHSET